MRGMNCLLLVCMHRLTRSAGPPVYYSAGETIPEQRIDLCNRTLGLASAESVDISNALNGLTLRVGSFDTAIDYDAVLGWSGLHYEILARLAQAAGFDFEISLRVGEESLEQAKELAQRFDVALTATSMTAELAAAGYVQSYSFLTANETRKKKNSSSSTVSRKIFLFAKPLSWQVWTFFLVLGFFTIFVHAFVEQSWKGFPRTLKSSTLRVLLCARAAESRTTSGKFLLTTWIFVMISLLAVYTASLAAMRSSLVGVFDEDNCGKEDDGRAGWLGFADYSTCSWLLDQVLNRHFLSLEATGQLDNIVRAHQIDTSSAATCSSIDVNRAPPVDVQQVLGIFLIHIFAMFGAICTKFFLVSGRCKRAGADDDLSTNQRLEEVQGKLDLAVSMLENSFGNKVPTFTPLYAHKQEENMPRPRMSTYENDKPESPPSLGGSSHGKFLSKEADTMQKPECLKSPKSRTYSASSQKFGLNYKSPMPSPVHEVSVDTNHFPTTSKKEVRFKPPPPPGVPSSRTLISSDNLEVEEEEEEEDPRQYAGVAIRQHMPPPPPSCSNTSSGYCATDFPSDASMAGSDDVSDLGSLAISEVTDFSIPPTAFGGGDVGQWSAAGSGIREYTIL